MGLLIAECLPDETAIDRVDPWIVERDDIADARLQALEPFDDAVPLAAWDHEAWHPEPWCLEPWEPPVVSWLEMRLGALRQLFSEEDE